MKPKVAIEFENLLDRYRDAYRAGDCKGCAAIFTENARLISPYGPALQGRRAIVDTHREWMKEGGGKKTIRVVDAGVSGEFGWCLAEFSEGDDGESGTSLNVLERQSDGSWLITICSLNEPYSRST